MIGQVPSGVLPVNSNFSTLPGHINNKQVWVAKFGVTKMYFYMTPDKHEIGQQLIKQINAKQIKLVSDVYENPRTVEMAAIASILPENSLEITSDVQDPLGQKVLNAYAQKAQEIAEKVFNIHILGASREINFIVSHDAHSFHRDSFPQQFKYMEKHFETNRQYVLVHDLALKDWDMADHTISGTMFHDPISHDRFLVSLLPKDEVTMFSVEPISYNNDLSPPKDPGSALLPYHTVLSPEDIDGTETAGSSKGQRVSMVLRGLIDKKEEQNIGQQAQELTIMRPIRDVNGQGIKYPNGIMLKSYPEQNIPDFILKNINVLPEKQNVEVLEILSNSCIDLIVSNIRKTFEINSDYDLVNYYRITKRDGGFTALNGLELPIPSDSIIILINRSILPKGYKYYQISEDQSDLSLPWIQFYQFNPNVFMKMTPDLYNRLSLAPIIELIYRDETQQGERKPCKKFSTKIDVLVLSKGK